MRLFVALDVPEEARRVLRNTQDLLREELAGSRLGWQDTARSHLTLKFLGDVSERSRPACEMAVQEAARSVRPFRLTTGALGVFPSPRRPSVLWLGLAGDVDALSKLQAEVSRRLEDLSPQGDHPFRPHLTLARVKSLGPGAVARLSELLGQAATQSGSWQVDSLRLMRSRLRSGGAVHEVVTEAELARP